MLPKIRRSMGFRSGLLPKLISHYIVIKVSYFECSLGDNGMVHTSVGDSRCNSFFGFVQIGIELLPNCFGEEVSVSQTDDDVGFS
jgi:hypothetical protein